MKYKTFFYEVNENGKTQEEYFLEINEKIPDLEMEADIALPDKDYIVVDKFYNLVFEEDEDDWVFATWYGVTDQDTWYEQAQGASPNSPI